MSSCRSHSSLGCAITKLSIGTKQGVDPKGPKDSLAKELATKLGGVTIVQKGSTDIISNGKEVLHCDEQGGLKRCGGQGDVSDLARDAHKRPR